MGVASIIPSSKVLRLNYSTTITFIVDVPVEHTTVNIVKPKASTSQPNNQSSSKPFSFKNLKLTATKKKDKQTPPPQNNTENCQNKTNSNNNAQSLVKNSTPKLLSQIKFPPTLLSFQPPPFFPHHSIPGCFAHPKESLLIAHFLHTSLLLSHQMQRMGMPPVKGMLVTGPEGVGKRYTVKRVGEYFGLRVVEVDAKKYWEEEGRGGGEGLIIRRGEREEKRRGRG